MQLFHWVRLLQVISRFVCKHVFIAQISSSGLLETTELGILEVYCSNSMLVCLLLTCNQLAHLSGVVVLDILFSTLYLFL